MHRLDYRPRRVVQASDAGDKEIIQCRKERKLCVHRSQPCGQSNCRGATGCLGGRTRGLIGRSPYLFSRLLKETSRVRHSAALDTSPSPQTTQQRSGVRWASGAFGNSLGLQKAPEGWSIPKRCRACGSCGCRWPATGSKFFSSRLCRQRPVLGRSARRLDSWDWRLGPWDFGH